MLLNVPKDLDAAEEILPGWHVIPGFIRTAHEE
jgi:hypothetical protein